jgi:TonB family protein
MNTWIARIRSAALTAALVVSAGSGLAADTIAAARDLYAAANYEEALLLLNRLRSGEARVEEARLIEQYRAFCLLALGRAADAEQAIEAVVSAEPFYQPSDEDASPRVRTAFVDVRRRMLPVIVQQRYASAKAAYDRKAYKDAIVGFRQVLDVLGDPAIGAEAGRPPLSDIRTLAAGFHDLSVTAAAPPPPPPPPPPAPEPAPPVVPLAPRFYQVGDPGVVAPVAIKQTLPPFPTTGQMLPPEGAIEVTIDEQGRVESVSMRSPLSPAYDRIAVLAAKNWQYRPATLNGVPVKYRKIVQIVVKR